MTVDTVTTSVNRVFADASTASVDDAQEDLTTSADGAVVLTTGGDLTVNAGTAMTGGITATGTGDARLDVTGAATLNAAVDGGAGDITVLVSGSLTQEADGRSDDDADGHDRRGRARSR